MFQKCSFCPTLQIRGLLERSHSSHPTTVRAVNERLIRHAQGSPSGSLSPRAIGLCRTFRNSTPPIYHSSFNIQGLGRGPQFPDYTASSNGLDSPALSPGPSPQQGEGSHKAHPQKLTSITPAKSHPGIIRQRLCIPSPSGERGVIKIGRAHV